MPHLPQEVKDSAGEINWNVWEVLKVRKVNEFQEVMEVRQVRSISFKSSMTSWRLSSENFPPFLERQFGSNNSAFNVNFPTIRFL